MNRDSRWWLLLPSGLRTLPADLAAVIALTVLAAGSAVLPVVEDTPLRVVLGLPFVLFVPGYAFIAALFPEEGQSPALETEEDDGDREGIDGIERVALSFGTSIAIVPLLGLVLNFTPWGIRLVPILVTVGGFTIIATGIAAQRRRELPAGERLRVPYLEWYESARAELLEPDTRADAALNVLLVLSVLLATASVGYAVAVPKQGESFTEFYLLTESEDGGLVADDYPREFVSGESKPLVIGIGNQEHETVNYTIVVKLQDVRVENNSTTVLRERELRRFETNLAHNETWHRNYSVTPTMTGERLRLAFLLYEGRVPADASMANAYREVHLWVTVSRPS